MHSFIKPFAIIFASILLIVTLAKQGYSQESRFSISINSLTTNFNYGSLNNALRPYKKDYKGLQVGFSYQAGVTSKFSIVPEIYFAIKGGTLKNNNELTNVKSTVRLYSIELPVLARLHLGRFYANVGPYVGYTLGGRLKQEGNTSSPASKTAISFGASPGDFKRWDAGLQAGIGCNFKTSKKLITLDARYGYGLLNLSTLTERYNRMLNISFVISKRSLIK